MRISKIPKKSGGFRKIVVPNRHEKRILESYLNELHTIQNRVCDDLIVHGFKQLKSPVTNAYRHCGLEYTLSFDISDFFDTVKTWMVKNVIPDHIIEACFYDDGKNEPICAQGLPTSPLIANIAAARMDKYIAEFINTQSDPIVYTRYADDLTFSFNDYKYYDILKKEIPAKVFYCGFSINDKKTRLQSAKFGRRVITGVSVGVDDVRPTRQLKRKMRAAKFTMEKYEAQPKFKNNNTSEIILVEDSDAAEKKKTAEQSYSGLKQWSLLKLPTLKITKLLANGAKKPSNIDIIKDIYSQNDLDAFCRTHGLGSISFEKFVRIKYRIISAIKKP